VSVLRVLCWLTIITLSVAGLGWAVQQTHVPGATASAVDAAPSQSGEDTTSPDSSNLDSGNFGRRVLELTRGLGGFRMPCVECHRHLGPAPKDPSLQGPGPHKYVVLNHGENNRCFNCHHPSPDQYGSFTAHDGSVIPVATVEELCGKCHGPHYRAWKRGAHGQRSGHWDPALGWQSTAHCNECHDPHQPYFKSPPTLSGPRTLRGELSSDQSRRTESPHGTPAE